MVKRPLIVATLGLLLVVVISAASANDGTFASEVLSRLTAERRTRLGRVSAEGKHRNHHLDARLARTGAGYEIEVVEPHGRFGRVRAPASSLGGGAA